MSFYLPTIRFIKKSRQRESEIVLAAATIDDHRERYRSQDHSERRDRRQDSSHEAKTRDEIDNREVLDRYESSAITYDDEAFISNMCVGEMISLDHHPKLRAYRV